MALPMATISKLVAKVDKQATSERKEDARPIPAYGSATYKRYGEEVWALERVDDSYMLWHYETLIMTARKSYKTTTWVTVFDPVTYKPTHREPRETEVPGSFEIHGASRGISVSDQQGMNALLKILGINGYVSRKGNTADYGGIPLRRGY